MKSDNRAYLTDFHLHKNLIHQLSRKCYGRIAELQIYDYEYEDVFQLNCIAYVKARDGYNPDHGITFTAYLGRVIYNNFNKFIETRIKEAVSIGIVSYDDFEDENGNEAGFLDFYNPDPSVRSVIEELLVRSDEVREVISKLSPLARLVIRELLSPSEQLKNALRGMQEHAKLAQKMGVKYVRVPKDTDFKAIKAHYGFRHRDVVKVREEFFKHLGVKLE